jgi:16S rRNA U516 pseudouridylate synthase RsuA-like enzyme
MRLNRYIAFTTGHSRRNADKLIAEGKVFVKRKPGIDWYGRTGRRQSHGRR